MYQIRYETQSKLDLHQSSELILRKMSNLEVKLEKQDSRTEKKEALFRRMPSLRDLASECSSADVQDVILPSAIGRGLCRDEPLTDSGKKLQLMKMLCLTVLPVLGVWSYSVYMLSDTITIRSENEMTRKALEFSVELGKLVHHLQKERDMSVLYLSALKPETKTFLLTEYIETDRAINRLQVWPGNLDKLDRLRFETKTNMIQYLARRRQALTPSDGFNIQDEINFYTDIIKVVIKWMYDSINETEFAVVWKPLVAYQKLTSAKEDVGVERALGTVFYANGGFESHSFFEMYNTKVHNFRAYYKTAKLYSERVDMIYASTVQEVGNNLTEIIDQFRFDIQHHVEGSNASAFADLAKARHWFDNMTIYLDALLNIQQDLGSEILAILDTVVENVTSNLTISAAFLVIVILMCPFVIWTTENLTSSIQKYALTLVDKTRELTREKRRIDSLLYQLVPKPVAEQLKQSKTIEAQYFKSATILFSDVFKFNNIMDEFKAGDVVELLNELYYIIDSIIDTYDIYKVNATNDAYMVASGLPNRKNDMHARDIAMFALNLLTVINQTRFSTCNDKMIQLRIGINTGPCMAGIVGSILPRYGVFGETLDIAYIMKSSCHPNKIHITQSTCKALESTGKFIMKKRGTISAMNKGDVTAYWLVGMVEDGHTAPGKDDEYNFCVDNISEDMPGEIAPIDHYKRGLAMPIVKMPEIIIPSKKDMPQEKQPPTTGVKDIRND
ncbi:uncharacterized protein [Magallana gigas]|uniref:uncharacterized protein isoform X1 n=2 Tax=Magallana gigas TaxID=29159 RepID=UPI0005C37A53